MSLFSINSCEKKNDYNWYTSSAISAVSASMIGKPFAVEMTSSMTIASSTGAGKMLGASSIAIGPNAQQTMIASVNVKQIFTSLGNVFFTLYGKQFFTSYGKEIFIL